jgi:hypothetical protein
MGLEARASHRDRTAVWSACDNHHGNAGSLSISLLATQPQAKINLIVFKVPTERARDSLTPILPQIH